MPFQSNLSSQPYFGGGVYYDSLGSTIDGANDFILVGSTYSNDFIDVASYYSSTTGDNYGNWDVFVARYKVETGQFDWVGEYGGENQDCATDVIVDYDDSQVIVVGSTYSDDFPSVNALQQYCSSCANGRSDAFILMLDHNDGSIDKSTFWGGAYEDLCHGVDIDNDNNIFIVGETNSSDFPTFPPYQSCANCPTTPDVFVCKFQYNLNAFQWGVFYGGEGTDNGLGIKVANYYNLYLDKVLITGATNSPDLPLENPYQDELNGNSNTDRRDAFVAKFSAITGDLEWSTYFGGADEDFGTGISSIINDSLVVITGFTKSDTTESEHFPYINRIFPQNSGALDKGTASNAGDAFVSIFLINQNGYDLFMNEYWGGSDEDRANDLYFAKDGSLNITGYTKSSDFPLYNSFQNKLNGNGSTEYFDAFYAKYAPFGEPLWSTYYGGSENDFGVGIAIIGADASFTTIPDYGNYKLSGIMDGVSLIGGFTNSSNIPLNPDLSQSQEDLYGMYSLKDVFVASFSRLSNFPTFFGGPNNDVAEDISIDADGYIYITGSTQGGLEFPITPGVVQSTLGGNTDAFIAKFNDIGVLMFSTYYGGTANDCGKAISSASAYSDIYITGFTSSTGMNYSDQGYTCYQSSRSGNRDAFLLRLSPNGDVRRFFTYYGGTGDDAGLGLYHNSTNPRGVYVTGYASTGRSMVSGYQTTFQGGSKDAFIARFNEDGSMNRSTYFGGSGDEGGMDIAITNFNYNIAVTGYTASSDLPTTNNGYDISYNGSCDGFLAMLDSNCYILNYGTFLGGTDIDSCTALDNPIFWDDNVVLVTGHTKSDAVNEGFPMEGYTNYDNSYNGEFDAFIAKFDRYTGDWVLQKSTYFGGSENDFSYDIEATSFASNGQIFITGSTKSDDLMPVFLYPPNNYNPINYDAYIARFDDYLDNFEAGSYYGGSTTSQVDKNDDWSNALILDRFNQPVITGGSKCNSIWDISSYAIKYSNNAGFSDAFITKFSLDIDYLKKQPLIEKDISIGNIKSACCFDEMTIYPNPASGKIYFQANCRLAETLNVEVYNILGVTVGNWYIHVPSGKYTSDLDIGNLQVGFYFLKLTGSECQAVYQFIIK